MSDHNLITSESAYKLSTPKFLEIIKKLLSDSVLSRYKNDLDYVKDIDLYFDPSDPTIFYTDYKNIIIDISNTINKEILSETPKFIEFYLLIDKIYTCLNDIVLLNDKIKSFNLASSESKILSEDLIYDFDNLEENLFLLSINNIKVINKDNIVLKLLDYHSDIKNDSILNIIVELTANSSFYSNKYIESYLDKILDKILLKVKELQQFTSDLDVGINFKSYNDVLLIISNQINKSLSDVMSEQMLLFNIVHRLNFSPLFLQKLDNILLEEKIVFSLNNLNIIDKNLNEINSNIGVTEIINFSEVEFVTNRINSTLNDNTSSSEVDLLIHKITSSYSLDKELEINHISGSVRSVIFDLSPKMLQNTILVNKIDKTTNNLNSASVVVSNYNNRAKLNQQTVRSKINDINVFLSKYNYKGNSIGFPFFKSMSTLMISMSVFDNFLGRQLCTLSEFACMGSMVYNFGGSSLKGIVGLPETIKNKTETAITSAINNIKNGFDPRITNIVSPMINDVLSTNKSSNVSAVNGAMGSVVSGKLSLCYDSITGTSLLQELDINKIIEDYITQSLGQIKSSLDGVLTRSNCSASAVLPGVGFPNLNLPSINMRLPNFKINPLVC